MSSQSALIQKKGKIYRGIFCRCNGHPFSVGRILQQNYRDNSKVDHLMSLGALSSIGEEIGEKHDFNWRAEYNWDAHKTIDDPRSKMCNSYIRDKGEETQEHIAIETESLEDLIHFFIIKKTQFIYVFKNGTWFFNNQSLCDVLSSSYKNLA